MRRCLALARAFLACYLDIVPALPPNPPPPPLHMLMLQAIDLVEERDPTIKFDVTVARSPFFLYPGGGHSIKPWGERIDALYSPTASQSIGALGAAAGYNFDFSVMLSDTMDSHRLVLWAGTCQHLKYSCEPLCYGCIIIIIIVNVVFFFFFRWHCQCIF